MTLYSCPQGLNGPIDSAICPKFSVQHSNRPAAKADFFSSTLRHGRNRALQRFGNYHTGFRLLLFKRIKIKPHRLKPVLLKPQSISTTDPRAAAGFASKRAATARAIA